MNQPYRAAKDFLRQAADFVWPPRSLVGRETGIGQGPLSAGAFAALGFITSPVCGTCGRPMPVDLGTDTVCAPCLARPPRWNRARAALVYDDTSRPILLGLKRAGRRDGLPTLAAWMIQAGQALVEEADVIVPVPLHYTRLVYRGFNQSAWLAAGIARRAGKPVLVDALKRTRRTPSQGGLSARARRRNVAGAFRVGRGRQGQIAGRRVLLIDDVFTTGATLSACCRALKQAGAGEVDVLVLSRVVRDEDVTI